MSRERTFTYAVADLLKQQPGVWVHWRDIAQVGGACAWRTRLSDARKQFGMRIENRVRYVQDGMRRYKVSEYRYVAPTSRGQQRLWGA